MQAYPLTLNFDRGLSVNLNLMVRNAQGSPVMQAGRSFTLKSKFEVCAYQKYGQQNYTIAAPKLMQWKMAYDFWNQEGEPIGRIQSAVKPSQYNLYAGERLTFGINICHHPYRMLSVIPTVIVVIGTLCLANSLPNIVTFGHCLLVLGVLSLLVMHFAGLYKETYRVQNPDGRTVMQFARSNMHQYQIEAVNTLNETEETALLLGVILLIIQDRAAQAGE